MQMKADVLVGVEWLAVIVGLELVEHRELKGLVERDARQFAWHRWKDPLFVASHVVEGRDWRVEVAWGHEQPGCYTETGHDALDRRRPEDHFGSPFADVLHRQVQRAKVM